MRVTLILIISWISGSVGLCFENGTTSNEQPLLITFGSGPEEYSNKTPSTFGFNTNLTQVFQSSTSTGMFAFYNVVPRNTAGGWHAGARDHTENDLNGYMYLVDFDKDGIELYISTVTDLCIGLHYQFSAYLTNVVKNMGFSIPSIRFEVRTTTPQNDLLAKLNTGSISVYENMTWEKYALSFIASNSSVNLRIISDSKGDRGNDLAIDDIELHVCSSGHSRSYFTESLKVCHDSDAIVGTVLFSITFGSGSDAYSKQTPCSFDFSTSYEQLVVPGIGSGTFGFGNQISPITTSWHVGAQDHTANDIDGYMYLIDLKGVGDILFRLTIHDLCLGIRYQFSAYLANVAKRNREPFKPSIRYEVRTISVANDLITQLSTGEINDTDMMTWYKHSLSFVAPTSSVQLLIIAESDGKGGNDLAIDDIELTICSNTDSASCSSESSSSCLNKDSTNSELLVSLTFDSGLGLYSNKTPSEFAFRTSHEQAFGVKIEENMFDFVNIVPNQSSTWHVNSLDHTANDAGGYMYLINAGQIGSEFFRLMINGLCIGLRYEFSTYLANLERKGYSNGIKPNVQFQIRNATIENLVLAQLTTGDIPEYDNITWLKYGLSFIANSHSLFLSIISNAQKGAGNNFALDDIEISVCSSAVSSTGCSSPQITLIPSASILTKRLPFGRSKDVYITSRIQLNFDQSPSSITYEWTVFRCLTVCSTEVALNNTTSKELFIPSETLSSGIYELRLTVIIRDILSKYSSSSSVFIEIFAVSVTTNLVSLGRLKMKHHWREDLLLSPGNYSTDPIRIIFDSNKWHYQYYCRIYDSKDIMNNKEFQLFDDKNQSCFSNRSELTYIWYENSALKSSVKITSGSLKADQTYQFMVQMIHRDDSLLQSIGYLFVEVENIVSYTITIGCLISSVCPSIPHFQYVNRNNQLTLVAFCFDRCPSSSDTRWKIYQGTGLSQSIQWTIFNPISSNVDLYLFGLTSNRLTITKDFFDIHKEIIYWRFEVIYLIESKNINQTWDVKMNESPQNGFCNIDPPNGTIETLFTINCSNWIDDDGIKDYTFYGWTKDPAKQILLHSTSKSLSEFQFSASADAKSLIYVIAHIRDTFDCVTKLNLSSVTLYTNQSILPKIIDNLQNSILQNVDEENVVELVSSLSNILNNLHEQQLETLLKNGIPLTNIAVSSLTSTNSDQIVDIPNDEIREKFEEELNQFASIRQTLMMHVNNLSVSSLNDLTFQSSMLAELTQTTNQLTRTTSTLASEKCHRLSQSLEASSTSIRPEDIQSISSHLLQCAANVMTGLNGPLQGRTTILKIDLNETNAKTTDQCSTYNDHNQMNMCRQKETATNVRNQISEMISSITSSLILNLNVNESVIMQSNSLYFSLAKLSGNSLVNRTKSDIRFPSMFNLIDSVVLLRTMIEPLSFADGIQNQSAMKFSRSISFSMLDQNGKNVRLNTTFADPIEVIIPRDPSLSVPKMYLQNVTEKSFFFNYHFYHLQINYSIHFEVQSLNRNLSYLFIYHFDLPLQSLKPMESNIDGHDLLCDPNNDTIFKSYLDNHQTFNHQTVIFGIRELTEKETERYCQEKRVDLKMINTMKRFSSDYQIRSYLSACFYLDQNNQWQSDGLMVGPLTNHYQTQCLSTHLL